VSNYRYFLEITKYLTLFFCCRSLNRHASEVCLLLAKSLPTVKKQRGNKSDAYICGCRLTTGNIALD